MQELEGDKFRAILEDKLEVDLKDAEVITTLRGFSRAKDGKIHTDSQSKIVTVLLYLNKNWDNSIGNLRLLKKNNNLEDYIQEISAEYAKLALLDGPINKSPLGIPVRIFEELEAIEEGSSLKEFLDSIQRDAQPYQRKRGRYRKQNYDFSAPTDGMGLLEQRRMSEQRLENIDLYNKTEKPAQIERIRQSVAEMQRESGESLERPRKLQRPKDTPESSGLGSGPSRASQSLADVLQKKQKK